MHNAYRNLTMLWTFIFLFRNICNSQVLNILLRINNFTSNKNRPFYLIIKRSLGPDTAVLKACLLLHLCSRVSPEDVLETIGCSSHTLRQTPYLLHYLSGPQLDLLKENFQCSKKTKITKQCVSGFPSAETFKPRAKLFTYSADQVLL